MFVSRGLMRENLIREMHNEGLRGHFGVDKTKDLVDEHYYWSGMAKDDKKWVERYQICQHAKCRSQNIGLYMPFIILEAT
jgi:hypothetical protein